MRETGSNSLEKKQKREFVRAEIDDQYSMTKICPKCGTTMVYAFGETYECPKCGNKEYTDFGKIREYLETHGPQNAVTIADATGVSVKTIQKFLYQGRIEIPDGSDSYIKCQMCGADLHHHPAGDAPAKADAHRQPLCHHEGQGVPGAGAAAGQMALGGRGGGGGLADGDHRRTAARRGAARFYLQLGRRRVAVG